MKLNYLLPLFSFLFSNNLHSQDFTTPKETELLDSVAKHTIMYGTEDQVLIYCNGSADKGEFVHSFSKANNSIIVGVSDKNKNNIIDVGDIVKLDDNIYNPYFLRTGEGYRVLTSYNSREFLYKAKNGLIMTKDSVVINWEDVGEELVMKVAEETKLAYVNNLQRLERLF